MLVCDVLMNATETRDHTFSQKTRTVCPINNTLQTAQKKDLKLHIEFC